MNCKVAEIQDMYLKFRFNQIDYQRMSLTVLTKKNVNDTCNFVRKPRDKNADRKSNREQQVSVIAQANLKLAVFIFPHRWRCTFAWEVTGVHEDTRHLQAGHMRLEDKSN